MNAPHSPPAGATEQPEGFWTRPIVLAAAVLLSALPLLWPDIPPLIDLPGHMGRYRVELDLATSPGLQRWFTFEWALIGNLGIDLLVVPLSELFGLELAVKLIVLTIPSLAAAGMLWVAREVHGRVPPTAFFALPLAYGYPFQFGFANFSLAMALALLAFGLWLRLGRQGRLRLRAALFVPISILLWICHAFGWGTLGVLAFSAELVRRHDRHPSWPRAALQAGLQCLALAPPALLMLAWRSGNGGAETADFLNLPAKLFALLIVLRDRWVLFDILSLGVIALLLLRAVRSPRIGFSRNLAASALFLAVVFVALPRIVFGSAYADMRLAPYVFAVAIVAIRLRAPVDARQARRIALAALAFFVVRTGATTGSFLMYDRSFDRELAATAHIPVGARLVSFVAHDCGNQWKASRHDHLPALALVRRQAFANDQWTIAGAQLLGIHYPGGGRFVRDPSHMTVRNDCQSGGWLTIDQALARFPRDAFDYVWLIAPHPYDPGLTRGLRTIWQSGDSRLFEVVDRTPVR